MVSSKHLAILCSLCLFRLINGCTDAGTEVPYYKDPEGVTVQVGDSSLRIANKTGMVISVFVSSSKPVLSFTGSLCVTIHTPLPRVLQLTNRIRG